jgi:hypothetical protein
LSSSSCGLILAFLLLCYISVISSSFCDPFREFEEKSFGISILSSIKFLNYFGHFELNTLFCEFFFLNNIKMMYPFGYLPMARGARKEFSDV